MQINIIQIHNHQYQSIWVQVNPESLVQLRAAPRSGGLSSSRATLSLPGAPAAAGRDPGEKDMEVALGSKAMEAVHVPRNPSVNC